ncbi:MAG: HlyD family secretion protein, partial [Gaiellaceae bacterium]|nr:HlyD family secretion protein [Gaiellaceae bacterium]
MSSLPAAIASRAPRLGRGSIRWLNLGLLALAALIGVVSYLVVSSAPASTASAVVQQTGTVRRGVVLSSVSATGSVVAAKDLTLNFQSSGTLTHVDVKAGQQVTRGQVLGRIDSTDAAASMRQAKAALSAAQANLQNAVTGETAAQRKQDALSVTQAKAAVTAAETALKNAKSAAASDNTSARQALSQAQQQLKTDQGGEAVAVAQQKTDLGTYADLAAAQAVVATAQGAVNDDQSRQHSDQQTQFDLQAQQLQWNQQLTADNAAKNTSAASNDQAVLNSLALQLQVLSKTLSNDAYQLSQDQATLSAAQGTVSAIKADASSIQSYEAKIVADKGAVAGATTKVASTVAQGTQSIQSATQQETSAKLQAANAALGVTVKQAPPTASVKAQLESAIVQAETNLATAQRTLSETTLRAPVGGTVASVDGIVGQSVSGGGLASATSSASSGSTATSGTGSSSTGSSSSGFVTLVGLSSMQVTAAFAESDVAKLAVGQPATVTVSALGGAQLAAHIAAINPIASSSSSVVQYTVTFALDRANRQLKPGMTANVAVTVAEKDNVLQVPSAAVTGSGRNARVTVLKNGVSQTVPVVAGLAGDISTEIVSGLTAGQTYVISTTVARSTGATGTSTTPSTRTGTGLGGGGFA